MSLTKQGCKCMKNISGEVNNRSNGGTTNEEASEYIIFPKANVYQMIQKHYI